MKKQAGQILLIVILVIIVASTIGLSLASRTITSLRTSTEEAESQKALAAAEAGIERAIQDSIPVAMLEGNNPSNRSSYKATAVSVQSSSFLLNGRSTILDDSGKIKEIIPNTVPKDEGVDVWFVDHDTDGNPAYTTAVVFNGFLHLYWGLSSDSCNEAAIQAVIITRNPSLPDSNPSKIKSYRYTYDGCSTRRGSVPSDPGNHFTSATSGSFTKDGITLNNKTKANDLSSGIPASEKIILMRVIPIYKDAVIRIEACNNGGEICTELPSQGYVITSTGTSGQAVRKLTVFKGYPQTYLPYLSYGLFVVN